MKLKVYVIDLEIPAKVKRCALRIGIPAVVLTVAAVALAAPALHTWMQNDPLNATDLNANFSQLQNQITTPTYGQRTPSAFRAWTLMGTSIQNDNAQTVLFEQVDYDLAGEYSTSTGAFSPKQKGIYLVTCALEYAPTISGQYGAILEGGNGIGGQLGVSEVQLTTAPIHVTPEYTSAIQLSAGDSITCAGAQSSGTAQPLLGGFTGRNMFSAVRLY